MIKYLIYIYLIISKLSYSQTDFSAKSDYAITPDSTFATDTTLTSNSTLISDSTITSDSTSASDTLKLFNLNILSNMNNAKVFFDTVYIGVTPLMDYKTKEGVYNVKIINPKSLKEWQNENQNFNLLIDSDTTITVNFRYFYYFNTIPFGAKVIQNDSVFGETPLRYYSENELKGSLIFRKKNYKDFIFDLKNYDFETGKNISLMSKGKESVNDIVYKNRGTQFETKRQLIPIIALGAASIAGAIISINFKNTSNEEYARYLLTGNEQNLNESTQNDTYFIISLVAMQAAIGGLIYFLFFD